MAEYKHQEIEKKWQKIWKQNQTFKTEFPSPKPKYYVLDMFPYPSGAGLHVGHPLGYIATDIVARYKRLKGFNVLHPMGFDSFGLPAEQYAVQTGQHPAITTEKNIARYKEQLDNIGFSYDWSNEVRTSESNYYKWTQWIFIQLFNSWYDKKADKARSVKELYEIFEKEGNNSIKAVCDEGISKFSAQEWTSLNEIEKHKISLQYRLAYLADTFVNWCPGLGTVLANEEVKDGFSERGGFPVERKLMPQWQLRITAYAERLIKDLDSVDWPEPIKEQQKYWIGKSKGCMLEFNIQHSNSKIEVFTTRVDTIYGVTYLTLAPEHELVEKITTKEQQKEVEKYVNYAKNKSERDRQADVKTVTGAFTGAYAINPLNGALIPIWIGEYVLAGYGTGAVMAVPSSDTRDYAFAKHFNLPIIAVQEGAQTDITKEDFDPKAGTMINSNFLNGMNVSQALDAMTKKVEELGVGYGKINYKIRDAIFSRQRYWGEPIPVYFKDGLPFTLDESKLPLELPQIDEYKPTESGDPPLARAKGWNFETSTMPGWAGSSWYFLRYMDANNSKEFASKEALSYWQDVDLYLGGSEHATGHLLYSRFWQKFLFDLGLVEKKEYAKKLINQGMIQGRSNFVYRVNGANQFVSFGLMKNYDVSPIYVDVNIVENDILDIEKFKNWREEYKNTEFILENGKYLCGHEVEKMSKSKFNVVNPDDVVEKYGADCLRMYEMFLGPLEQSKPWSTASISGVSRFLKNVWKLFFDEKGNFIVTNDSATDDELRILHKTIKKVEEDIERFSFNTSVSTFMVCVNELSDLKCHKKEILENLLIILAPYAPHISEELWDNLKKQENTSNPIGITYQKWPKWEEKYLKESAFEYPISVNGKVRHKISFAIDEKIPIIEQTVLASSEVQKWLEGKAPKKVIVVPNRIVNVVI
jgi:leucyl-tRNA synthetase